MADSPVSSHGWSQSQGRGPAQPLIHRAQRKVRSSELQGCTARARMGCPRCKQKKKQHDDLRMGGLLPTANFCPHLRIPNPCLPLGLGTQGHRGADLCSALLSRGRASQQPPPEGRESVGPRGLALHQPGAPSATLSSPGRVHPQHLQGELENSHTPHSSSWAPQSPMIGILRPSHQ